MCENLDPTSIKTFYDIAWVDYISHRYFIFIISLLIYLWVKEVYFSFMYPCQCGYARTHHRIWYIIDPRTLVEEMNYYSVVSKYTHTHTHNVHKHNTGDWITWADSRMHSVSKLSSSIAIKHTYFNITVVLYYILGFPRSSVGKESPCNAGDLGSIPGTGRSSGEGNGHPPQYSCLENPMDGGSLWATVHEVTESDMTWRLNHHIIHYYITVITINSNIEITLHQ